MNLVKLSFILSFFCLSGLIGLEPKKAPLAKAAADSIATKSFLDACQKGLLDKAQKLANPALINAANEHGITPLIFACYQGHSALARFLLARKANPNACTRRNSSFSFGKLLSNRNNKTTPLMMAAYAGKLEIVLNLLKSGAQVNAQDSHGQTALIYAILGDKNWPHKPLDENRKKIISLLLEYGADTDIADINGLNALYYYAQVAGLVPGFGDRYEHDPEAAAQDYLLRKMQ